MHWGATRTVEQTEASQKNVWKNNKDGRGGYVGVWHMGKASGAESEIDATGNGLDGVPYSESNNISVMKNSPNDNWPTGACRINADANGQKNALQVPDYSKVITDDSRFTVSGWFRCSNPFNGVYKRFFSATGLDGNKVANGWEVRQNGDGWTNNDYTKHQTIAITAGPNGTAYNVHKLNVTYLWNTVYITVVFSDRIASIYQDGVLIASDNIVACKARQNYLTPEQLENDANDFGFLIGHNVGTGNSWVGFYDEVRMYDGAETADRIKANYDTMKTPNAFLTMPPTDVVEKEKEVRLLFAGYTSEEILTDFQALVKLSEGQYGFSYEDYSIKDGSDLWFTDAEGNVLPHEIDTWNPNGDSFIWVRVPEIVNSESYITMHWGKARTAEQTLACRKNVWKNNKDGRGGYVGVWHMGNATLGESEYDSTGNGLHAAPYSETGALTKMIPLDTVSLGFPTKGRQNAAADGENNSLKVPLYKKFITNESKFTLSGWFRCSDAFNSIYKRFFSSTGLNGAHANNGWILRQNGDYRDGDVAQHSTLALTVFDGEKEYAFDDYRDLPSTYLYAPVYLTVAFDGKVAYVYQNGNLVKEIETGHENKARESYLTEEELANPLNAYGFTIGCYVGAGVNGRAWVGYYDEIRMYDGAESATRVKANYDTMKTPTEFLVADNAIIHAQWTGLGSKENILDPLNWVCKMRSGTIVENALPTKYTDITISGDNLYFNVPAVVDGFEYKSISFATSTLGENCDWSGLDRSKVVFAENAKVDLNGRNLVIPSMSGSGMITNSVDGVTSELTLKTDVAAENTAIAVGGNIKFIKEGNGVFTSSKALTYTGETIVNAGTIQASRSTAYEDYDETFTPFGTGKITVNAGSTFNAQSLKAYRNNIILNGGTVSGGVQFGNPSVRPIVMLEKVTADSFINHSCSAIEIGTPGIKTDLNGYTVTVTLASETYFRWHGSLEGVEGKLILKSPGYLTNFVDVTNGQSKIDLELQGSVIHLNTAIHLRDFTANNGDNNYARGPIDGVYVCGIYTPVGNNYYGCILQDGATINLSARTLPFSLASSLKNISTYLPAIATEENNKKRRTVRFDDNATVKVDVGDKVISQDMKIISWDANSKPANLSTLNFILKDNKAFYLQKRSDGVYASRFGLSIRVR
jgi:autotransporter-associated beta strand protein